MSAFGEYYNLKKEEYGVNSNRQKNILSLLGEMKNKKVLDLGCANGVHLPNCVIRKRQQRASYLPGSLDLEIPILILWHRIVSAAAQLEPLCVVNQAASKRLALRSEDFRFQSGIAFGWDSHVSYSGLN